MKKIIALALAAALVLGLTACHGSREKTAFSIPERFDTSRDYEITFWAKNDTNMTQVNIYKQAIADFEALYPNITVNLRLYTCLLYTSPSPRDKRQSRMPSSA